MLSGIPLATLHEPLLLATDHLDPATGLASDLRRVAHGPVIRAWLWMRLAVRGIADCRRGPRPGYGSMVMVVFRDRIRTVAAGPRVLARDDGARHLCLLFGWFRLLPPDAHAPRHRVTAWVCAGRLPDSLLCQTVLLPAAGSMRQRSRLSSRRRGPMSVRPGCRQRCERGGKLAFRTPD
jgi:hypothetical protein